MPREPSTLALPGAAETRLPRMPRCETDGPSEGESADPTTAVATRVRWTWA